MIDEKRIRANPEALREAVRLRKVDPQQADVDRRDDGRTQDKLVRDHSDAHDRREVALST